MQALKATLAREINRADITEAETLVFEGRVFSQTGKQAMEPGEFYFRAGLDPRSRRIPSGRPVGQAGLAHRPEVVMACPFCSALVMKTPGHTIRASRATYDLPRDHSACPNRLGAAGF
jgi:hypothetical protein